MKRLEKLFAHSCESIWLPNKLSWQMRLVKTIGPSFVAGVDLHLETRQLLMPILYVESGSALLLLLLWMVILGLVLCLGHLMEMSFLTSLLKMLYVIVLAQTATED